MSTSTKDGTPPTPTKERKEQFQQRERHLTPPLPSSDYFRKLELPEVSPRTASIIWRDVFFLVLGCIATSIIGFVESHAADASQRFPLTLKLMGYTTDYVVDNQSPFGIVDTGFILTQPLYEWLKIHRDWNDLFAALNSLVLVPPFVYMAYVTVWKGDYTCSFRVLAVQLLRAFCGWFTYLPPDPTYLNSYFDFPDIVQCLFQDCRASQVDELPTVMPFVSFFSGHVATMVVCGNHMWLMGFTTSAMVVHVLNAIQIVRLLATRGHYSIDMIIGWYMAVHVSAPAGRLGRYYSREGAKFILPHTPSEVFEQVTGIADSRKERQMSVMMNRPEVQDMLRQIQAEEEAKLAAGGDATTVSDTTARIFQETAKRMMQEQMPLVQEQLQYLQQQAKIVVEKTRQQQEEFMHQIQEEGEVLMERLHPKKNQ